MARTGEALRFPGHAQHGFFRDKLDGGGEIHLALGEQCLRSARRTFEQGLEFFRGHAQARAVVKITQVEGERAVRFEVDDLLEQSVGETRPAVGREAHELVFAGVDLEAAEISDRAVEQAERVGKVQRLQELDTLAPAMADRRGVPFADAVDGEDRSFVERRRKKRTGGVRFVVVGEDDLIAQAATEGAADFAGQVEFGAQPRWHREHEGAEAGGSVGEIRFEEPVEFKKRLFVKYHVVDLLRRDAAGAQHIVDRLGGKTGVVSDPGKPLLLRGRDDFSTADQAGRAIVVITGESEDERGRHSATATECGRWRFRADPWKKQGRATGRCSARKGC